MSAIRSRERGHGSHFDWDAMNRLHGKGLVSDPVCKAKSVTFTDAGLREAEAAFRRLFEVDNRTR